MSLHLGIIENLLRQRQTTATKKEKKSHGFHLINLYVHSRFTRMFQR